MGIQDKLMRIGADPVVSRDVLSMRLLDCAIFYTAVRWNHGCEEVNCSPASREAAQAASDQWRTRALGEAWSWTNRTFTSYVCYTCNNARLGSAVIRRV